ncbi:uncharacterized protein EHS24_006727 [Apiotrichum porosum]|uniref:Uncharacterized protein n=1 Tax=Apiotrichum porosum TaxID=105984 RepID=A0A427XCB9_9TREE|nr:uncharacterized protein EHS24_006727 [Apiotrichum porosum]RSH76502.1 hypothetical protein EHS24_006727 [Apiotrichum porosum]
MLVVSRLFQEYWLPLPQCDDDIDTWRTTTLSLCRTTDGEMAFHLLVNRVWLGGIEDEVWDILHGLIPDFDGTGVEIVSL